MGVGQNLVDLPDVAGKPGGWIEARETAARRTTAAQRRDAPDTAGGGAFRAASWRAFQRAKRFACPGRSSSAAASAARRRLRRVASIGSSGDGRRRERKRLGDAGKQDARGGVCGHMAAAAASASSDAAADRRAAGSGCAGGRHAWRRLAWPRRRAQDRRRHHDGDAETAQEWLRGRGLRPGFARGRQGHDQTTRGRDDQPPRGGFGRTQQPQYGEPEMAGQGGRQSDPSPGSASGSALASSELRNHPLPQGARKGSLARPWRQGRPGCASAPRDCCDIAAVPSIAASFQGRRDYSAGGRGVDKQGKLIRAN